MRSHHDTVDRSGSTFALPPRAYDGLGMLCYAFACAEDAGSAASDFAVEIERLRVAAMTECDLRWLIQKGYARHVIDVTIAGEQGRSVRPCESLTFLPASCFILTADGVDFARRTGGALAADSQVIQLRGRPTGADMMPRWDCDRRELVVGDQVVKHLRFRSHTQQRILAAFQWQGWPTRIDDPLPAGSKVDARIRLNKAVYRLNHRIDPPYIQFRCDGGGTSVSWELVIHVAQCQLDQPPAKRISRSST